jgi:hypothetical protein
LETIKRLNQTGQESKIIFCAFEIGELRVTLRHQQQAPEKEKEKEEKKERARDPTIRPLVVVCK